MPAITYSLKNGGRDPLARWFQATAMQDIARSFAAKSGDTSTPTCKGVQLRKSNEIIISTTAVVTEPQKTADAMKVWINSNHDLAKYGFLVKIECYDQSNKKTSVSA
jgi:hypothetical protein